MFLFFTQLYFFLFALLTINYSYHEIIGGVSKGEEEEFRGQSSIKNSSGSTLAPSVNGVDSLGKNDTLGFNFTSTAHHIPESLEKSTGSFINKSEICADFSAYSSLT
jgi:hypothetical protein